MSSKIGFLVNPIAGMGGKVGLKGTDNVVSDAIQRGAIPSSPTKAIDTLNELHSNKSIDITSVIWYTCAGEMGVHELQKAGINNFHIIHEPKDSRNTTSDDTIQACKEFMKTKVDIILFCGGDGTARDIYSVVKNTIPILGIPAGVKMHSAVFGITPSATAKILQRLLTKNLTFGDVEIMDLDEDSYRKGEWKIRLFGTAKGIIEPTYVQVGKSIYESVSEDTVKDELAEHINDEFDKENEALYLLGPGSTIDYIAQKLRIQNTLLGIDAVYKKKVVAKDVNEQQILDLLSKYKKVKLILSPIGAQGFILGRGNLQLSPAVIKKIGLDNFIILATPSKLLHTPFLRVDIGDKKLDEQFKKQEFFMVAIGYRISRVVHIAINNF